MFSKPLVAAASLAMFSLATAQVTSVSPSQVRATSQQYSLHLRARMLSHIAFREAWRVTFQKANLQAISFQTLLQRLEGATSHSSNITFDPHPPNMPVSPSTLTTSLTFTLQQSSKIAADLYLFGSSLGDSPQFTSYLQEIGTGIPSAQLASIESAATSSLSGSVDYLSFATAPPSISFPPWATEIPQNIASDVKAFDTSFQLAGISVVRSDLGFTGAVAAATGTAATGTAKTGAAATARPGLSRAAGLAAGAMGIAAAVL